MYFHIKKIPSIYVAILLHFPISISELINASFKWLIKREIKWYFPREVELVAAFDESSISNNCCWPSNTERIFVFIREITSTIDDRLVQIATLPV